MTQDADKLIHALALDVTKDENWELNVLVDLRNDNREEQLL